MNEKALLKAPSFWTSAYSIRSSLSLVNQPVELTELAD